MSGPEARFVQAVNRKLSKRVYTEGMANPYRGGTPDRYYEGDASDIFIEYKYKKTIPKKYNPQGANGLSALQTKWLNRAYENGRKVAVIVGFGDKCLILKDKIDWSNVWLKEDIENELITKKEAAEWIEQQVLGEKL